MNPTICKVEVIGGHAQNNEAIHQIIPCQVNRRVANVLAVIDVNGSCSSTLHVNLSDRENKN